ERNFQVGEGLAADGAERFEHALEVLAGEEAGARDVEVDRQVEQPRQDAHDAGDVTNAGRDLLEPRRREAERVVSSDDRPHARSGHDVDGDLLTLEHIENSDVRESPRGPASEGESYAPMREMAGEASKGTAASDLLDRERHQAIGGERGTRPVLPVVNEHDA